MGADKVRLKEGKHINKSLMVLGNMINKFSEGVKQRRHIPYCDNKLDRMVAMLKLPLSAQRHLKSLVQDVANSCRTEDATNVLFGLALGYQSVIIPIFAIAVSIFLSFSFYAMYDIVVAALGMLSTIATRLAIDAYGPISDNVGGIAEMADALDEAGNTTAAIGKGFAIGSAALVSLALFGAFVSRASISNVDVLTPKVFIGLLIDAMIPYWFSSMTMKSVGSAALKMMEEVRRQFNTIPGLMEGTAKPDYATCVKIPTDAFIKEMIPPGDLVMLTPLIVGTFFGVETLSGGWLGHLYRES
ncbi:Pyrophosphate-energized vacuolar membrane proton pump, partial [Bienertia sinuspersici]